MLKLALNRWLILLSMLLAVFYQAGVFAQTSDKAFISTQNEQLVAEIKGSMCPVCLKALKTKIAKMQGVINVYIESQWDIRVPEKIRMQLKKDCALVHISFNNKEINTKDLLESIKANGFTVHSVLNSSTLE